MHLLAIPFSLLELIVFLIAVAAFGLAVRFFIASQRNLEGLLPDRSKKSSRGGLRIDRDGFIVPSRPRRAVPEPEPVFESRTGYEPGTETRQEIKELRDMLQLQQLELTRAMRQIEAINTQRHTNEPYEDIDLEDEDRFDESTQLTEGLREQLARKEAEITELRQQVDLNRKLQTHFEDVQEGYAELQEKVQKMEQQAWQSAELAIKADNLTQEKEQLEKTVVRKEEKIRELSAESGRLHNLLAQTEDKLSEANLQRQQLMKKVQFLEEINSDIQQMGEANRKLKTELRRVAELESMLNLITEERDALLKRRVTRF